MDALELTLGPDPAIDQDLGVPIVLAIFPDSRAMTSEAGRLTAIQISQATVVPTPTIVAANMNVRLLRPNRALARRA